MDPSHSHSRACNNGLVAVPAPKVHFVPAPAPELSVAVAAPKIFFNPMSANEWSVAMAAPEIRLIPVCDSRRWEENCCCRCKI
jgi:hypothetical protein